MNSSQKNTLISSVHVLPGIPVEWDVLRLDTLHPVVSGNKIFKLRPWLEIAEKKGSSGLVTFGGPWSNHIVATAFAARERGWTSIGIIRGEASVTSTATLEEAKGYGMDLRFLGRSAFRAARETGFRSFIPEYPGHLLIPEGGAGEPGIRGAAEILELTDLSAYTHIACACGTGTMMAGIVRAAGPGQQVLGVDVVGQGDALEKLLEADHLAGTPMNWRVMHGFERGGYARVDPDLIRFMNRFWAENGVPSDIIYTGKLFMAMETLIRDGFFPPGSRLLTIQSGGLQGNRSLPAGAISF